MGKNYAESSLKHYLKQKVRITLGVVVTFLITGVCTFTEEKTIEEINTDFIRAEKYLNGLETKTNLSNEWSVDLGNNKKIEINATDNKITFSDFSFQNANGEVSVNPKLLSTETWKNIETAFKNAKENELVTEIKAENLGVMDNLGHSIKNVDVINRGIIVGQNGQTVSTSSKTQGINYGIIRGTARAQYINASQNSQIYNYGLLIGGQVVTNNSNYSYAENNGLVLGSQNLEGGQENHILNYGVISNINESGQKIATYSKDNTYQKNNNAVNYGIIEIEADNPKDNEAEKAGQIITGYADKVAVGEKHVIVNSHLKNYGYIESNGSETKEFHGQSIYQGLNNTAENFGVVKTNNNGYAITIRNGINADKDIANGNKGFNYGTVIVNTENTTINQQNPVKVFEGDVTNKGIVILDKYTGTDLTNIALGDNSAEDKGLIFKKGDDGYSLLNNNKVAEYKNGNSEITNKFTDDKKTAYVTGIGNKITENLSDKVIGTIVTDDISEKGAVLKVEEVKDDKGNVIPKTITLENTVITGYFENSGTLLDMGSNNLTLLGDTKLVASRDDFNSDIAALNIDGKLKMLGNAEIAGKIIGNGEIQQIAVNGEDETGKIMDTVNIKEVLLQNATEQEEKYFDSPDDNYTKVTYNDLTTEKVVLDFDRTAKDKENTITFTDDLLIKGKDGTAIDGTSTEAGSNINLEFSSLDKDKVQGDILLGASDDDITVSKNGEYNHIIDMGAGNDTFTVNINGSAKDTFDYQLDNTEKIVLKGKGWYIGDKAELNGGTATKAEEKTELHIADNGSLFVEMNNNFGKENVTTSLDKMASGADLPVTTGEGAEVRFVVGDKFDISQKQFDIAHDYSVKDAELDTAIIFKGTGENGKVQEDETGKITLTVKEGAELGFTGYDEFIYDIVLGGLSKDEDLRNAVNNQNLYQLQNMIKGAANTVEAFYTTGYAVTKDVTDTYMSVAEDFGRKAGKGEWIAYGKYVNSDTEFDGGKASKGYDGDITGTVGMIEYGVNDTTSYGVVYGQGDTEVNIDCGGKLDGDNSYFGGYVKHRTQKGIDIVGNIGITKSELDLSLATNVVQGGTNHQIITDGKSDADALTIAVKGTKDYRLSDSVRLQPVVSARYSFITQDEVTSSDAKFRMEEQDVTIFEGSVGGNIIKDFNIYNGTLSLSAGAEYVLADINADDNTRYYLYSETKPLKFTEEEEIADNRIEGHIGAEYIHENGVGIDAKYEMIWTDKGDTDRITAGVSYRF